MSRPIRIAVASGKGGTGKTTIATNLAKVLSELNKSVTYIDCDVEEPNGHIFLKPTIDRIHKVTMAVPEIDRTRCTYCGACGEACRFSAIITVKQMILTFPELCHGCGGCSLACPENAISEVPRLVGVVEQGVSQDVSFIQGRLNVGEAMAPPVIRAVIDKSPKDQIVILDAPPGTSCPVIESVKTADVVLLVTEPTPFGLNDLKLAVEMVREIGLPFAVAVNRTGIGDNTTYTYCEQNGIPILMEIPDDRSIAQAYSRGKLITTTNPQLKPSFSYLYTKLCDVARQSYDKMSVHRPNTLLSNMTSSPSPSELYKLVPRQNIQELVVISGKGGTGKTSILASFFALAEHAAATDCDVDAADLHLLLNPTVKECRPFSGGNEATILEERCSKCGLCIQNCRFNAIHFNGERYLLDQISCEGCGVCADICPDDAITMEPAINGEWFVSDTSYGPLVHARLGIAQENSGKLVSLVRKEGKALAYSQQRNLLLNDGSPGIGCPVIASIANAQLVLVVIEPTLSGLHDFKRVAELTKQFKVKTVICINKFDINPELTRTIEEEAHALDLPVLGYIHYDESVTIAQVQGKSVVEYSHGPAAKDIRQLWELVSSEII